MADEPDKWRRQEEVAQTLAGECKIIRSTGTEKHACAINLAVQNTVKYLNGK